MGNFQNLSTAIVNVLDAITVSGQPVFADVEPYPTLDFKGTPAVTVAPSDNESDYATIVQNLRTYVFFVDVYYPIENEGAGYAVAFAAMMPIVDACLDAFDNSNLLNYTCQILTPTPSSWSIVQSSMGALLTSRIILHAKITVDTDNG